ncbi:MAG: bacillithiol system redox-active protein YtxJ [Ignavibacteriae bacterium]|nr:bacillithiol system redox-active protein YtxJ [Ignavibacteriota bacterium]MCB9214671.1 bacillithiol system redox-active protein YtxJ [Ignavibacteria bacterium]
MQENQINIAPIQNLQEESFRQLLVEPIVVLYKHSPSCGVSLFAQSEILQFALKHTEIPVYQVDVLRQRPLSTLIATETGIPHKSPQVILLREGKPLWNTSHFKIRATTLADVIAKV